MRYQNGMMQGAPDKMNRNRELLLSAADCAGIFLQRRVSSRAPSRTTLFIAAPRRWGRSYVSFPHMRASACPKAKANLHCFCVELIGLRTKRTLPKMGCMAPSA